MDNKNNQNKNNGFEQFMQDQPFDDLSLNIDSRYFDMGVGYNKKDGARLSATIDLNSVGQMTEADLYTQKAEYQKRMMELNLQNQEAYNKAFQAALQEGRPFVFNNPQVPKQPSPVDLPYIQPPKKEEEKPVEQPVEQPKQEVQQEEEPQQINTMGAKAFFDEDE